jgi:UDPglucose--hexose-1-phosphate uridylyltransferase
MTDPGAAAPHRRYNPLTDEWLLVSPQRTQRPWLGETAETNRVTVARHDPACFLCAGNTRVNGKVNPAYVGPHVFANDFPAMRPTDVAGEPAGKPLFRWQPARGESRVLCFSERHDLTLARLGPEARRAVVAAWIDQFSDLGARYAWVAIFENKGAMMGCSNPHPHGQIWASDHLPTEMAKEDRSQAAYLHDHGSVLLCDYAEAEAASGVRVVIESDHWIAVVPWWAVWPFETLLMPRRHVPGLPDLTEDEADDLSGILGRLTTRYDNLFTTDFPYSMGWHGAPPGQAGSAHWQLHAHFYPPLLRSAQVRKFMVGYEMLGEPQRDLTAERAAEVLRNLPELHYVGTTD